MRNGAFSNSKYYSKINIKRKTLSNLFAKEVYDGKKYKKKISKIP